MVKINHYGLFFWLAMVSCSSIAAAAQNHCVWQQHSKLVALDSVAGDAFGRAVAIDGNCCVVGACWDDEPWNRSGSAYVFELESSDWVYKAKLIASDVAAGDEFGSSVSVSGSYAVVGAPYNDSRGSDSGCAYIFKRDGSDWVLDCKLTASDGDASAFFGEAVSISGTCCIVGAPGGGDDVRACGAVYVFERQGDVWTEKTKLLAADGAADDRFGYSVSLSGQDCVVGAPWDDNGVANGGSVYIFTRDHPGGDTWQQQAKLVASDAETYDLFGSSVSISGDYALVGSPNDDENGQISGSAYLFVRNGLTWMYRKKLTPIGGETLDQFGWSVCISGDRAIVGAPEFAPDEISAPGSAYVFQDTGDDWVERTGLRADDEKPTNWFGLSVCVSGNYAIIGAWGDSDKRGAAYVYRCAVCPSADLDGDCLVDFSDLAIMAGQWLQRGQ